MFAASPSPTMEAAFGRLHKDGRAAFGGTATFVDSIVGDGEAANIAKTYAYTYQMCLYFDICHLSYILPYVSSIEIGYSPITSMENLHSNLLCGSAAPPVNIAHENKALLTKRPTLGNICLLYTSDAADE